MLPLEIILLSAIPNHTFSCKEVSFTKSPGGKSLPIQTSLAAFIIFSKRCSICSAPNILNHIFHHKSHSKNVIYPQGHFNDASKYLRGANQPSQQVLGACNTHQESINTLLKLVDSRMIIKTS
jgi:hypothetical protein